MKKLFAILLACVMLLNVGAAMAEESETPFVSVYTPLQYTQDTIPAVNHILKLTTPGATDLPYTITYKFTVDAPTVVHPTGIEGDRISYMVSGKPVISPLSYGPQDSFDADQNSSKTLSINWDDVKFREPGLYRWKVTKELSEFNGPEDGAKPSNDFTTTYLYALVIDNNGSLQIHTTKLARDIELNNKDVPVETFPATKLSLSIGKNVTGTHGSKDQYFKFLITLDAPASATLPAYLISGYSAVVPTNAYHSTTPNGIQTTTGTKTQIELWLKNGETATISNLLFGTTCNIVEYSEGYEVTTLTTIENGASATGTTEDVTIPSLEKNTTVTYTNMKNAITPTGIDLQTGAPIMGLLLAASMLLMLFISKRREAAE